MEALLESPGMGQQKLDRDKVKERRKELGLTQTEAAKVADLSGPGHWSAIEQGQKDNVTIDTLSKIAKALRCDARDLITPPEKRRKGKK